MAGDVVEPLASSEKNQAIPAYFDANRHPGAPNKN